MIDEVLKVVNKFIPDKGTQAELTLELAKLEIQDFKEKKGIITKAFHLVFSCGVFVLICMVLFKS